MQRRQAIPAGRAVSRRQALRIVAAAAGLPLAVGAVAAFAPTARFHLWQGEALGAAASLTLWHPREDAARQAIDRMLAEVDRIERAFSLFRPDSEIARLNRDGRLDTPSSDWHVVLGESLRLAELSDGSFDPTVQPLWDLFARHFTAHPGTVDGPPAGDVDAARALVGYRQVDLGRRAIRFGRPGMGVTLNGIAQGYITDRVADMLRDQGFEHVFVELGEIRALGNHPEGRPWRLGVQAPDVPGRIGMTLDIANEAVAISGGYGTRFDPGGRNHHIFDPMTGASANRLGGVTVIAQRAMIADGLSTAVYVAGEARAARLLSAYPGARAIVTRPDGSKAEVAPIVG